METNPNNQGKKNYTAADAFWFFVLVLIFVVLFIFIFQYSWNGSIPYIFGFRPITFVQALLLLIVARMLFPNSTSMGMYYA
jgi:hypothetical protein